MFTKIAELPENVRTLPDRSQRIWLTAFNGAEKSGKSTTKSVAIANAVAQTGLPTAEALPSEIDLATKEYQYVDSWEYESRKLSQVEAGYSAVGGDDKAACSNCFFFVSPARCTVVSGIIAPNGLSNEWRVNTPVVQEPTPVTIVKETSNGVPQGASTTELLSATGLKSGAFGETALGEKPSLIQRTIDAAAKLLRVNGAKASGEQAVPISEGLLITKQSDGTLRWVARYSNSWEDRDREIVVEASQKAYVEAADATQVYPELWLWHTPGTRFGQADWLDFADGFAFASGTIDKGKEYVVKALEDSGIELGVSHGFLSMYEGSYVVKHFTVEVSVLPLARAAVWTTDFNVITKETDVALTAEKRPFLAALLGEDRVKELEANTEKAAEGLKALNVSYKESNPAPSAETPTADPELVSAVKALGEQFVELSGIVSGLAGVVAATKATVAQVAKSDDEKTEEAFLARVAKAASGGGVGARPTAGDSNVIDPQAAKLVEKELGEKGSGDFFTDRITKDLMGGVTFAGAAANG